MLPFTLRFWPVEAPTAKAAGGQFETVELVVTVPMVVKVNVTVSE